MNIKTTINAINKQLKEVFDLFGGQSEEYMNALKQVRDNIPDEVLQKTSRQGLNYAYDMPSKPLQLSAGKEAQNIFSNFQSDLQALRENQKASGSALMQAQKYINDLKQQGKQFSRKAIKEKASGIYHFRNNANNWYEDIMKSAAISEEEKSLIKADYSELNGSDDYEYGVLRQKIEKNYNRLRPKIEQGKQQEHEQTNDEELPEDVKPIDPNTAT